jgi:hypothetical protein
MTTPMTWMWSPTYSRCDESAIFLQESKDDAGTECGSLGGGGPASQTLQETARDVGQDERGRCMARVLVRVDGYHYRTDVRLRAARPA